MKKRKGEVSSFFANDEMRTRAPRGDGRTMKETQSSDITVETYHLIREDMQYRHRISLQIVE
jgi:hypothetical protein